LKSGAAGFPALRSLTSLELNCTGPMLISAPLQALSNLRELDVYGSPAKLLLGVALPPSLTNLILDSTYEVDAPEALPKQVSPLSLWLRGMQSPLVLRCG
jgi:hypothetical protein